MRELYTPREAAERLGISYPTIKQWIYRGKLRAIKTVGGHYRIDVNEIKAITRPAARAPRGVRAMSSAVSGRNQLVGRITQLRFDGLLAQVKLDIGGQTITAVITADAARTLNLAVGQQAAALIKATEVMIFRV
jgi:molybdopterin-binding protein